MVQRALKNVCVPAVERLLLLHVRQFHDCAQEVGRHEGSREGGGPVVCTFRLDGGIDVEGVDELHDAVKVVLPGHHHPRVHKVDEGLHQARLHFGQDQGDVLCPVAGVRLEQAEEKGRRHCQQHLVGPHHTVLAVDRQVDKVLLVVQHFGLQQTLNIRTETTLSNKCRSMKY